MSLKVNHCVESLACQVSTRHIFCHTLSSWCLPHAGAAHTSTDSNLASPIRGVWGNNQINHPRRPSRKFFSLSYTSRIQASKEITAYIWTASPSASNSWWRSNDEMGEISEKKELLSAFYSQLVPRVAGGKFIFDVRAWARERERFGFPFEWWMVAAPSLSWQLNKKKPRATSHQRKSPLIFG